MVLLDPLLRFFIPAPIQHGNGSLLRRARMLVLTGLLGVFGFTVSAVNQYVLDEPIVVLFSLAAVLAGVEGLRRFRLSGDIVASGLLLLYGPTLALGGMLFFVWTPHGPSGAVWPILIVAASSFLPPREYRFFGISVLLGLGVAAIGDIAGLFPSANPMPLRMVVAYGVANFLSVLVSYNFGVEIVTGYAIEAKQRLRDEQRFRMAVKGLGVGVWEWDPVTQATFFSEELRQMFGVSATKLDKDGSAAFRDTVFSEEDRRRFERAVLRVVESREESEVELRVMMASGPEWFRILLAPEFERNEVVRVVGATQNITGQKLRGSRKTMFVATMSHELRTPLNGILGMADLMDDSGLPDQYRSRLRTIQASGEHMLQTINDVLDFAKIEAGALAVNVEEVNLRKVMVTVLSMFRSQAVARRLDISLWIEPDVPETIETDAARLGQVVINLVGNAVKFTEDGSIRVWVSRSDHGIVLGVVDTGVGIPSNKLSTIFTPFERVDSKRNRMTEGQGLGLAIGRRIIELLGGSMSCTSTLGVGSEFLIRLPTDAPPRAHSPRLSGHHVIVAGLGNASSEVVGRALHAEGCVVTLLQDCNSEHELESAPELVIIPGSRLSDLKDSWILRRWPEVKIVMVSRASTLFETSYSPTAVLEYPIDQSAVVRTLERIFQGEEITEEVPIELLLADECPLRIGIAEDDPVNRMVTTALLKREGYVIKVAEDGEKAVEMVERGNLDLVLMDLHMPVVDGLEATQRIRQSSAVAKQPYIVAFSADVTLETRQLCVECGMDDVLRKPARRRGLRLMLRRSYMKIHENGA